MTNTTAKKKARALQAETGMPYTAALAKVLAQVPDDDMCQAEFPGDGFHAGQTCERPKGHDGQHERSVSTCCSASLAWGTP